MDFITYARAHGVIIDRLIDDGRWHRVPTSDKPHKRNGAYMYLGDIGFVQDWGTMNEAEVWRPDGDNKIAPKDLEAIRARARAAAEEIRRKQERAAQRAADIMAGTVQMQHPYLAHKGFPEEVGHVYVDEDDIGVHHRLCIPMYLGRNLVGLQSISDRPAHERKGRTGELEKVPAFEKRFLPGQRIDLTAFTFGQRGRLVLCEGYATALSVKRALAALHGSFRLVVTFTAGNMKKVAASHTEEGSSGIVVADNDKPSQQYDFPGGAGLAAAKAIGWPYWLSDRIGEDANDFEQRRGYFALMTGLKPLVLQSHAARRRA